MPSSDHLFILRCVNYYTQIKLKCDKKYWLIFLLEENIGALAFFIPLKHPFDWIYGPKMLSG